MHWRKRDKEVKAYLTDYTVSSAQEIFSKWTDLEVFLLVRFMDGNVKALNPDGSFVTNKYTDHIPAGIKNYDYTDKWKEAVVRDHGDVLESK